MRTKTTRLIGLAERPWAYSRNFQHLLGTFREEPSIGLYFAEDTPHDNVALIAGAFGRLPAQLQSLCREFDLTFSTCSGSTANGNSSTCYADFKRSNRRQIAPHIEMGSRSLKPDMVLPHLSHETAHIWWSNLSQQARSTYTAFLVDSCPAETEEVTGYAQEFFQDWQRSLSIPDSESYAKTHRAHYLEKWAAESFCETVAAIVDRRYPSISDKSTADLSVRRQKILELTGLDLG